MSLVKWCPVQHWKFRSSQLFLDSLCFLSRSLSHMHALRDRVLMALACHHHFSNLENHCLHQTIFGKDSLAQNLVRADLLMARGFVTPPFL